MTVAEWLRSRSDIELARFLDLLLTEWVKVLSERLAEQGVPHSIVEFPALSVANHLEMLQGPVEDFIEFEEEEYGQT